MPVIDIMAIMGNTHDSRSLLTNFWALLSKQCPLYPEKSVCPQPRRPEPGDSSDRHPSAPKRTGAALDDSYLIANPGMPVGGSAD